MSNDFVNYIKHLHVIEEAISPENYRDNQIGKIIDGKIVFVNNFLDKVIDFFEAFPTQNEYNSVGPIGSDPGIGRASRKIKDYASRDNYKSEFVQRDIKLNNLYPVGDNTVRSNYLSKNKAGHFESIVSILKKIKNKNITTDIKTILPNVDKKLIDKINSNSLSIQETNDLYMGIYEFIKKEPIADKLIETRGKSNIVWLVSPVKDAIYNTTYRDQLSKKPKIKENILKEIEDEIKAEETKLSAIKNLNTKSNASKAEKIQKKITELSDERDQLKDREHINFLKMREGLKHVVDLFKNIKQKINKNASNEFDKTISWRKLIFDYNNLTPSSLNNEILKDRKYIIDFLINLDFKINELEFDMGYVTPPEDYVYDNDQKANAPISFSDLIVYLKVKSNEIKPKDEAKLKKLIAELNLVKDKDYNEISDLKAIISKRVQSKDVLTFLKNRDLEQTFNDQSLKDMDSKDLFAWASKNGKTKEMQDISKRYDLNKHNQLLSQIKIFTSKSKEEYQKAITILENPKLTSGNSKFKIIFTLSPRTFLSQSTRANLKNGITSCMNIFFGCNRHYMPTSLAGGAFTAYLVKVNKGNDMSGHDIIDSKIIDPIGRVVIKPFKKDDGDEIYWYADKPYMDRGQKIDDLEVKVKTILNRYHNAYAKEGDYKISSQHYTDTRSSFTVDRLFKIVNGEEQFNKFKQDLASGSKEAEGDFNKILDSEGDNIFNLWGNDKFHPTPNKNLYVYKDIRKLPNGIVCNTMKVTNKTLSKLPDDLFCRELVLDEINDMKSNVTTLNNLKHLKDIEILNISNCDTPVPIGILDSEKIKHMYISNNAINAKKINTPNAVITVDKRLKSLPEEIICNTLILKDCSDISSIKKITCQKLSILRPHVLNKAELKLIENSDIKQISISISQDFKDGKLNLSHIKDKIELDIGGDITFEITLPLEINDLIIKNHGNITLDMQSIKRINNLKITNANEELSLPSSKEIWQNVYTFVVKNSHLRFQKNMLYNKKIFIDAITGKFEISNFFNNENKKLKQSDLKEMIETIDIKVKEELVINDKTKIDEILKFLNSENLVYKKLNINISKDSEMHKALKNKTIFITNDTKVDINITDNIKFDFNLSFVDEPIGVNHNVTINVDKSVKMIDISKLISSNKSKITIISESDDNSIYDDLGLKVIGSTNFIFKNKKFNDHFVPVSLKEIDMKHKLNVTSLTSLRLTSEDLKSKIKLTDYFNFRDIKDDQLTIEIYIYEIYHDIFHKLNIPYDKILDMEDEDEKKVEIDKILEKIKKLVDQINFEITDIDEINKTNNLYFDFKNITFNNEKFAKRNNIISIDKIDSIKKNIIQAYKINVALIEALYTKITVSIPAIYLLNQNRPKIVASKKGNSYLPEL